jgi:preprotein translocase subunit SecE
MKKSDQKNKKTGTQEDLPRLASEKGSHSVASSTRENKEAKKRPSPAISKRESERRREDKDSFLRYLNIAGQFLRESKMELKKVKWPTRKELLASTAAVIVLVLVISLYLGVIDFGLIKIIKSIVG